MQFYFKTTVRVNDRRSTIGDNSATLRHRLARCGLPLAFGAVVRPPLRHDDLADHTTTRATRFSLSTVHPVTILEATAPTLGIDIVGDGRTPVFNCLCEYFTDHLNQQCGAIATQPIRTATGVDPSAEQRLVGVDIPDATEY